MVHWGFLILAFVAGFALSYAWMYLVVLFIVRKIERTSFLGE